MFCTPKLLLNNNDHYTNSKLKEWKYFWIETYDDFFLRWFSISDFFVASSLLSYPKAVGSSMVKASISDLLLKTKRKKEKRKVRKILARIRMVFFLNLGAQNYAITLCCLENDWTTSNCHSGFLNVL